MIVEGILVFAGAYAYHRWTNREYYKYKTLINDLAAKNTLFKNSDDETVRFIDFKETSFSKRVIINISKILGYEALESQKDYLLSYFKAKDILFKTLENGLMQLDIVYSKCLKGNYEPIEQKEYELLVGYNTEGEAVKVNCNSFPHMLIGGDSGSGKSRFLLMVLSNLINNCKDIDLYLLQIRKSDLIVFKNVKQCKYVARSLQDTKYLLEYINNLCITRDKEIEKYTISKGIYNIEDYNRYFNGHRTMKYIYIVLDEFSFFTPNGADVKEVKEVKRAILGYIKQIVMVGRSVGVFIITSLQKPTNSSIPSDIKSQLTCRASFKMNDKDTSIVVLGNANARNLQPREALIRTLGEEVVNIPYIDHKLIIKAIGGDIERNKKYITLMPNQSVNAPIKSNKGNNEGVIDLEVLKNVLKKV